MRTGLILAGLGMLVAGAAGAASADRFLGTGFDGFDQCLRVRSHDQWRFRGTQGDGFDGRSNGVVEMAWLEWTPAPPDVTIHIAGTHTNTTYSVLGFDGSLTSLPAVLYQVSNTNAFSFTNTNPLAAVSRRFYKVSENVAGSVYTNDWIYQVARRQVPTGTWTKLAPGVNYGASNRLNSTLGSQLKLGLTGHADKDSADLFYLLDQEGNWQISFLNDSGVWCDPTSGFATNTAVQPWQSFWVKRRNSGSLATPYFSGYCPTGSVSVTFRSNDWHMITWPFGAERKEGDGVAQGWGLAASGGQKGTSWLNSDLLTVGEGAALRFYYLNTNGRWSAVGQSTPASSVSLSAGESYYYLHRGTGMVWTAVE